MRSPFGYNLSFICDAMDLNIFSMHSIQYSFLITFGIKVWFTIVLWKSSVSSNQFICQNITHFSSFFDWGVFSDLNKNLKIIQKTE